MSNDIQSLTRMLTQCIEAANMTDAKLDYDVTESVDTETESTNVTVRFGKDDTSRGSINLLLLLKKLQNDSVVSETDLLSAPDARVIIQGAVGRHNYKIIIQLE